MRSLEHIYSIWFLTSTEFVKPDIAIIFLQFMQDTIISTIHIFLLLYLNGTMLIAKLQTHELTQFFKKHLLNFIWHCANSAFNIHNPYGIKLLTRLLLGFIHLRDPKFRHCFQDTLNPLYDCSNDTETKTHFFSSAQGSILLDKPSWIILEISTNRLYLTAKIS